MNKAFVRTCVAFCCALLIGCAVSENRLDENGGQRAVADGSQSVAGGGSIQSVESEATADWRVPGVSGVDYDPQEIVIWYRADAGWPAGLDSSVPPAGERAEEQPNSILRQNKDYEALTNAFAVRYGLSIRRQLYWEAANFARFDIGANSDGMQLLEELNRMYPDCIEQAAFSGLAHPEYIPTDPDYNDDNQYGGVLWGMKKVNCAPAWDYTLGQKSVRVAVVDSGIRISHEELDGVVMDPAELEPELPGGYFLDIIHGDNTVEDLSGHGTMCAGAVGAEANGNTIIGVAPGVTILPIKIHDTGSFPWTDGYAGITVAHLLGADVISCSWGHSGGFNEQERTIVNQISDGGSLIIAAAGNDDTTASHYPSDFESIICVGASDPWDERCDFSNYGTAVDITAPGQWMKRAKHTGDSAYDEVGGGTSYACPMVAGAAGLLLSADSSLTNAKLREILETTGDPVTGGFQPNVLRMNVGNAMAATRAIRLNLSFAYDRLIYSGNIELSPEIDGEVDRVEYHMNGKLLDAKVEAPWGYSVDTTNMDFGYAYIEVKCFQGIESVSSSVLLLIDNTGGAFPLSEGFEDVNRSFLGLDFKNYDSAILQALRTYGEMGTYWIPEDITANGAGFWGDVSTNAYEGYTCKLFGNTDSGYDPFEADALISKRIDLTGVADPTVVFHQHYNIQQGDKSYDRAWVYVTADYGQTFTKGKQRDGSDAMFSGYAGVWSKVEIDLNEFSGQMVHLALVFESGRQNSGENAEQPAGWWVDDFTVATDYDEHIPSISNVTISPNSTVGEIVSVDELDVGLEDPDNVARAEFILEYVPAGGGDMVQLIIDTDIQPFQAIMSIPMDAPNQIAWLRVGYFSAGETPGIEKMIPVYIFNQLGDTNADGAVNQADIDSYSGMVGLTAADEGYIPFFDSDMNGEITEYDAAAVGYHWGE